MKQTKKVQWSLWRELLRAMLSYKKYVAGLVVTMLLTALIDVFFPILSMYVIDTIIPGARTDALGWFFTVYFIVALAQGLNVLLFIRFGSRIELGMARDLRTQMFQKLQTLSLSYYDEMPIGQITSRMLSDVTRLTEMLAWSIVDGSWAVAYMVGVIIAMFVLKPFLALLVLLTMPPIIALSVYFQRHILAAQRDARHVQATILSAFNEGVMGAQTTKTLLFEDENAAQFVRKTTRMKRAALRAAKYSSIYLPLVTLIGNVCVAAVLWGGGARVLTGGLTLGVLATFVNYATGFFEPVNNLAGIFAELQAAQAAAERVIELLHEQPAIADDEKTIERFGTVFAPREENWPKMAGHVTFENVDFAYRDGVPVLRDFSLDVPPGTQVALVGETGAGKTTIVQLLGRFYEPTSGRICIDGVDTRKLGLLYLHRNMGYVLQTPHLFSGTVRDNIRYGRPDASDEDVEAAARVTFAHEFIEKLPEGYDTQVGEGGSLLSTGQKQLIAFARAVLIDPAIFVLDEATASIDTKTEQLIQRAIDRVLEGRTSFVVAHRLSTIRRADVILVIGDGREIERGTHEELMKKRGRYWRLYTNQFEEQSQRGAVGKALIEN